jgi:ketosteroid isomerase-like protein
MKMGTQTPQEVVEAIADAYTRKDADGVLQYFADDARVIGSLRHEEWSRKGDWAEYLRRELEDFGEDELTQSFVGAEEEALQFVVDTETVKVVAREGRLDGSFRGRPFAHQGRWTCVLRNDGGSWLVTHSHFSLSLG